jgi:cytochrome c-type biogenesis protein CcmE
MKVGAILSGIVAAVALGAAVFAFTTQASPYVTIAQAKSSQGDRLHLAGDLIKDSVKADVYTRNLTFRVKDENGDIITVNHTGEKPANIQEATKVVAVGKIVGDKFESDQLIVKCPTKYEAES